MLSVNWSLNWQQQLRKTQGLTQASKHCSLTTHAQHAMVLCTHVTLVTCSGPLSFSRESNLSLVGTGTVDEELFERSSQVSEEPID
ncbi:hypothetical protein Bca101_024582 [Brassica carinata]